MCSVGCTSLHEYIFDRNQDKMFAKYANVYQETQCEHDKLYIDYRPPNNDGFDGEKYFLKIVCLACEQKIGDKFRYKNWIVLFDSKEEKEKFKLTFAGKTFTINQLHKFFAGT